MRITLVVAVCVAVVLLGQARISSQEVPDVKATARFSVRVMAMYAQSDSEICSHLLCWNCYQYTFLIPG